MWRGNIFLSILLAGVVLLAQGCSTTIMGPAGETRAVYFLGDLKTTASRDIGPVYDAAVKAMDELKLSVSQKTQDALSAKIIARDSQDRKITVNLRAITERSTEIIIRAGLLGSENKSTLIYKQIMANLQ